MFFGTGARSSVTHTAACPAPGRSCEPNALVVLVKTKLRTPAAAAASSRLSVPVTLVSMKSCLLWVATCGLCSVAVWITAVTPSIWCRTKSGSTIEPTASVKGDAFRSMPRAGEPRPRSVRRRASPRWPALPVTRIVIRDPIQPPAAWKTTCPSGPAGCFGKNWSGRRGSNPRPRPWQGRALPLSYTRILWRWHDCAGNGCRMPKAGGECNSYRRHRCAIGGPIWTRTRPNAPKKAPEPANRPTRIEIRPSRPNLGPTAKHMNWRRAKDPPIPDIRRGDPVTIIDQGNGAAGPAAADLIKDTTTQTFVKDVIEESKHQPVLIDFWAEWCGPCKQLTPLLEKAVKAAKGKVKLVKMNIDQHPAIPGQMGIQSIPAVIAFVNAQPPDGFMGAVPESQLNAFIEKLTKGVPAPGEPNVAEILQEAEAVLAEGDAAAAAQIYAEVLQHESTNIAALAGLAKCYAVSGAMEQAKQTLAMVPESKRADAAVKAVQVAIDLAEQAQAVGPVTELEQKVAANPLDHQARFDLATALNAQGNRAEATNQLLEIVKRDRKWNEDAARKQLVQFFEAWGGADQATVDGRKRLSTILFS